MINEKIIFNHWLLENNSYICMEKLRKECNLLELSVG